ncbi:hydrogenase expression protein HupH [Candidatus Bathyarchaeota archaeon]|nr:MAG: hydrogenase expression protein HupH [Candidatus Bathyarchaeota archaeon]
MRLLVLTPILRREGWTPPPPKCVAPDVEVSYEWLDRGAETVESHYDEYVGILDMIEKGLKAQEEGFDAIVINCFLNPALPGMRELLDIPVIGAGEAALHIASMLGDNFSILDPDPPHRTYSHRVAAAVGLMHKLRSVRYLNLGVKGLSQDFESILNRMIEEALKAIEEDGAHVIVLGCTGMRPYAERLSEKLRDYGVPIVEPLSAAIAMAESIVRLGLSHSRASYPKPADKKRIS